MTISKFLYFATLLALVLNKPKIFNAKKVEMLRRRALASPDFIIRIDGNDYQ